MTTSEQIIIFVNQGEATRAYRTLFDLDELDERRNAAICFSRRYYYNGNEAEPLQPDVLLISDLRPNDTTRQVLNLELPGKERIYVFFHSNSSSPSREQRDAIDEYCNEGAAILPTFDHSNSGRVYDCLLELGRAYKERNQTEYTSRLAVLRETIGDAELETKFELLNACLTIDGASSLLKASRAGSISADLNSLLNQEIDGADEIIKERIQALSDTKSTNGKPPEFEEEYITSLRELRDILFN